MLTSTISKYVSIIRKYPNLWHKEDKFVVGPSVLSNAIGCLVKLFYHYKIMQAQGLVPRFPKKK